ncbi:hypothetical protein [Rhodanobacter ginsengiterrae]|uniref:hypothetical protein n=1 Tax=Rhodanobacter ginsengiterrae TaxID=2008451 RepID=UPI003CEA3801
MPNLPHPILAVALGGLLLAGCAQHPATKSARPAGTTGTTSPSSSAVRRQHTSGASSPTNRQAESTDSTGIAACDDYLSSYLACHRAAQIYPPEQLQSRYEAMRSSLLKDAQNPDIRPQLTARCNSLASQLRQVLDGKSCAPAPAPAPARSTP